MTNRFFTPNPQFVDEEGLPYAGGKLYFYVSNSDTLANTYEDEDLSVANANPIILDELGCAGSVFLQNIAYKVRLFDADDNEIWTEDPVWSSDYSTYAALKPYNGNPNGFVSGHAGTVGTLPGTDQIWDYVNNILYVCTVSGDAATTVWTAVNEPTTATFIPPPTGYLTPVSGTPIIITDVTATSLVYTPFVGNTVPIYSGSAFQTIEFSELTLTLTSSQAANTLYDVFVFNNSSVLTLVTGPAWANSTAGSCSRGTGSSTTEIELLNGIWTNAVLITGRNGVTTYPIAANTATYLGTIFIDAIAGEITCHRSYGQDRKWAVWNAYNRQIIELLAGDSTSSWSYSTGTYRPSNNDDDNNLTVLCGLPEELCDVSFSQRAQIAATTLAAVNYSGIVSRGIGLNSTTSPSGTLGVTQLTLNNFGITISGSNGSTSMAQYTLAPSLGINVFTALEALLENAQIMSGTFYGTQSNMLLKGCWRG